jgi:hypothetical protein
VGEQTLVSTTAGPPQPVRKWPPSPPSEAYAQAKQSPVYRLSELMFGSLLASYVLGFIGVGAAVLAKGPNDFGNILRGGPPWIVFECATISIAYAYLTASSYLSYHAGILTMFHMPLDQLRWDFALALTQAVTFGLSLLFPESFPLMIGCALAAGVRRQHKEYWGLVNELWQNQPHQTARHGPPSTDFVRKVNRLLNVSGHLSGWRKPSRKLHLGMWLFLTVGGILLFWTDARRLRLLQPQAPAVKYFPIAIPIVVIVITVIVVIYGHTQILKSRATFLIDESGTPEMDTAFSSFLSGVEAPDRQTL